tara:strand:+ start:5157 stop:5657 length:501 start_codon:yes stop_codon:yes gene_type:complete
MSTHNLTEEEARKKITALAEDIDFCMLATNLGNKPLDVVPMSTKKVDEKGNIWFLSGADSDHNVNIKHDSFVQLIYSKPGSMEFLSIYADAAIITDRKPIEELYEKTDDTYFDGIDDPNITALSITPLEARYWEPKNNKFITLLKMAKGAITGEKADVGQSGKLLV